MKISIFLLGLLFCAAPLVAQETAAQPLNTIAVIGTAQLEIVPDEIYMRVVLTEFTKEKKKYTIEELETGLINFVEKTTALPRVNIKMDDVDASVIALKRKQKDAVITKTYEVKYSNFKQANQLLAAIDSLNCRSAYLSRLSHSKMDEYKRQIKINAAKAAQEKASYLLEALGQKLGKPVLVNEPSGLVSVDDGLSREFNSFRGNVMRSNSAYQSFESLDSSETPSALGNKTIKLNYVLEVTFSIL